MSWAGSPAGGRTGGPLPEPCTTGAPPQPPKRCWTAWRERCIGAEISDHDRPWRRAARTASASWRSRSRRVNRIRSRTTRGSTSTSEGDAGSGRGEGEGAARRPGGRWRVPPGALRCLFCSAFRRSDRPTVSRYVDRVSRRLDRSLLGSGLIWTQCSIYTKGRPSPFGARSALDMTGSRSARCKWSERGGWGAEPPRGAGVPHRLDHLPATGRTRRRGHRYPSLLAEPFLMP